MDQPQWMTNSIAYLSNILKNDATPKYLLGICIGNIVVMVFNAFVKKLSYFVIAAFPLFGAFLISLTDIQPNDICQFLDLIFIIIHSYLLVRFSMLLSFKCIYKHRDDPSQYKQLIILISFISISISLYIIYYCLDYSHITKLQYLFFGVNLISLVTTLYLENGIISDFACVFMFSTTYSFSSHGNVINFITCIRALLMIITVVSPTLVSLSSENDHSIVLFTMKKQRTRVMLVMTLISYFLLSPKCVLEEGNEICIIPSFAIPIIYCILLFYGSVSDQPIF